MRGLRISSVILLAALAAGCGVGVEESDTDTARNRKNEKLREEYDAVKGTYEGFIRITNIAQRFHVKFYLFWGEVQGEPLPGDLKPGLRVVLRGRLMQSEFVGDSDNLILTGLYDSVTGSVTLDPDLEISKTSTGCRLGGQDPIGIRGRVSGRNLDAVILRNGQEWARFEEVRWSGRDVSTGSVLSEEEEYSRLQKVYEPVTGTYDGTLSRQLCERGQPTRETMRLLMYIERRQEGASSAGTPCYVPRLTARTLRRYEGELADVTYRSVTRFDPRNFLPQFQSVSVVGAANVRSSVLELSPVNGEGSLRGQVFTSGVWGDLALRRSSAEVVAPDHEVTLARERRTETYRLFTGEYKGELVAYDKRSCQSPAVAADKVKDVCKWWVNLRLYEDERNINGVRYPVLMAYYTREQLHGGGDPTIGSRLMDVDVAMDSCHPLLVMHSEGSANPAPIPGIGRMHFNAEYMNGSMSGELTDHRGPQGVLTVKRR